MFEIRDIINPELKDLLLKVCIIEWDKENNAFIPGPDGGIRGFINIQNYFSQYKPDTISKCDQEIDKLMSLLNVNKEDYGYCRHFLGLNTPGANVTPHVDNIQFFKGDNRLLSSGAAEIRFNFYLQRPESGGHPCLTNENIILQNKEGVGWYFNAGILHHSTPVEGTKNRIVLSLGSVMNKTKAKQLNLI